jgi:hypothetical protein
LCSSQLDTIRDWMYRAYRYCAATRYWPSSYWGISGALAPVPIYITMYRIYRYNDIEGRAILNHDACTHASVLGHLSEQYLCCNKSSRHNPGDNPELPRKQSCSGLRSLACNLCAWTRLPHPFCSRDDGLDAPDTSKITGSQRAWWPLCLLMTWKSKTNNDKIIKRAIGLHECLA